MEKRFYALTISGSHHEISEEVANNILQANNNDLVEFDDKSVVRVSTIVEVLPYDSYVEKYPDKVSKDMHQPYSVGPDAVSMTWDEIKNLPAQGFDGLLNHPQLDAKNHKSKLERFLQGLEAGRLKVIAKGGTTANVDKMIEKAKLKLNAK